METAGIKRSTLSAGMAKTRAEVNAGSASGGGISNDGDRSSKPSLALDANDNPVVGWTGGNPPIHVKRWNGVEWINVGADGGISDVSGEMSRLALDTNDNPFVVWWNDNTNAVYIKRFDSALPPQHLV